MCSCEDSLMRALDCGKPRAREVKNIRKHPAAKDAKVSRKTQKRKKRKRRKKRKEKKSAGSPWFCASVSPNEHPYFCIDWLRSPTGYSRARRWLSRFVNAGDYGGKTFAERKAR